MSEGPRDARYLWIGPATAWLVLIALFAIGPGSAYLPLGAGNIALNLRIAAVMVAVPLIILMDLRYSNILMRVVSLAGLFWLIMMFSLTFSDYLSRSY
jgi:cytochrome c oxidase subunit IV